MLKINQGPTTADISISYSWEHEEEQNGLSNLYLMVKLTLNLKV